MPSYEFRSGPEKKRFDREPGALFAERKEKAERFPTTEFNMLYLAGVTRERQHEIDFFQKSGRQAIGNALFLANLMNKAHKRYDAFSDGWNLERAMEERKTGNEERKKFSSALEKSRAAMKNTKFTKKEAEFLRERFSGHDAEVMECLINGKEYPRFLFRGQDLLAGLFGEASHEVSYGLANGAFLATRAGSGAEKAVEAFARIRREINPNRIGMVFYESFSRVRDTSVSCLLYVANEFKPKDHKAWVSAVKELEAAGAEEWLGYAGRNCNYETAKLGAAYAKQAGIELPKGVADELSKRARAAEGGPDKEFLKSL
ncbi:MAG: hypothetical protein PHF51_00800 [Candidatus ainarchaeum sp.]|nr:hypothetical protein [Candidatus ainarchaeum sp.]